MNVDDNYIIDNPNTENLRDILKDFLQRLYELTYFRQTPSEYETGYIDGSVDILEALYSKEFIEEQSKKTCIFAIKCREADIGKKWEDEDGSEWYNTRVD